MKSPFRAYEILDARARRIHQIPSESERRSTERPCHRRCEDDEGHISFPFLCFLPSFRFICKTIPITNYENEKHFKLWACWVGIRNDFTTSIITLL